MTNAVETLKARLWAYPGLNVHQRADLVELLNEALLDGLKAEEKIRAIEAVLEKK